MSNLDKMLDIILSGKASVSDLANLIELDCKEQNTRAKTAERLSNLNMHSDVTENSELSSLGRTDHE